MVTALPGASLTTEIVLALFLGGTVSCGDTRSTVQEKFYYVGTSSAIQVLLRRKKVSAVRIFILDGIIFGGAWRDLEPSCLF